MKSVSKSQRIKQRQLRKKRRVFKLGRPLQFMVINDEYPKIVRLLNGTELHQAGDGMELYIAKSGKIYLLTPDGLCAKHVCFNKKRNYCKPLTTGRGHHQGQTYPQVSYKGKKYRMHRIMAIAWKGGIGFGEAVDHINGDIDNFSYDNIRVISVEENIWCGGILRRLRNAARKHNLPYMDPARRTPEDMLDLFKRFKGRDIREAMNEEIERQKVLHALWHAAQQLGDPSLNPDKMTKERREAILAKYRVVDSAEAEAIMEWEMRHHVEI